MRTFRIQCLPSASNHRNNIAWKINVKSNSLQWITLTFLSVWKIEIWTKNIYPISTIDGYRRYFVLAICVELNKFCETFHFEVIVLNSYPCLTNIFCKPRDILFVILPYYMIKQVEEISINDCLDQLRAFWNEWNFLLKFPDTECIESQHQYQFIELKV